MLLDAPFVNIRGRICECIMMKKYAFFCQVGPSPEKIPKQKKSLFAQQFMRSSAISFGIPDFKKGVPAVTAQGQTHNENMEVVGEDKQPSNGNEISPFTNYKNIISY